MSRKSALDAVRNALREAQEKESAQVSYKQHILDTYSLKVYELIYGGQDDRIERCKVQVEGLTEALRLLEGLVDVQE
jgi:Arc/MetJ-type ribon-helix-helix transcriptional regulator